MANRVSSFFFFFLSLAILGFILLPSALASYSQHCDDPCLPPGKDVLPAVFRIRAGAWSALTQHGRQQSARTRQHRFPPNPNAGRPGTQIHCNSLLLIFFFFTSCLKQICQLRDALRQEIPRKWWRAEGYSLYPRKWPLKMPSYNYLTALPFSSEVKICVLSQ